MKVLAEYCLPFVRLGGVFLAMKGLQVEDEIEETRRSLEILGGELADVVRVQLPEDVGERYIVVIRKSYITPDEYPRRPGIPKKNPL